MPHDLLLPGNAEGQRAVEGGFLDDLDGVLRQEADFFEVLEQLGVADRQGDKEAAVEWYQKAIDAGDQAAKPLLERLLWN